MNDSTVEVSVLKEKLVSAESRIALISQRVKDACDSAVNLRGSDADWLLAGLEQKEIA